MEKRSDLLREVLKNQTSIVELDAIAERIP